jgi:hypothetical protein
MDAAGLVLPGGDQCVVPDKLLRLERVERGHVAEAVHMLRRLGLRLHVGLLWLQRGQPGGLLAACDLLAVQAVVLLHTPKKEIASPGWIGLVTPIVRVVGGRGIPPRLGSAWLGGCVAAGGTRGIHPRAAGGGLAAEPSVVSLTPKKEFAVPQLDRLG